MQIWKLELTGFKQEQNSGNQISHNLYNSFKTTYQKYKNYLKLLLLKNRQKAFIRISMT